MRERGVVTYVDCPACGPAAETGEVRYWAGTEELHCRLCLFTIIAPGVVGHRGRAVNAESFRALTGWDGLPIDPGSSYRPPSERRLVLRLVPHQDAGLAPEPSRAALAALAADPTVSSITIRVNRRGGAR